MQIMKKSTLFFILSSFLTVILFGLDLCSGSIWINLPDVLGGGSADSIEHTILLNLRLPKAIVAVLAGAALSVSGLMMQTLFRNPLAGPYILGVSSGASLGVAFVTMCSVMLAWTPFVHLGAVAAAILGSTAVLLLVMAVSRRVQSNVSLLIVGMMFGSIAGAMVSLMQNFANPDALKLFIVWTLGSLESVGWTDMPLMAGIVVLGLVCAVLLMKPLNGLLLGEDYAKVDVVFPRSSRNAGDCKDPQIMHLTTKSGTYIEVESFVFSHYGYDVRCEIVCEEGVLNLPEPPYAMVRTNDARVTPICHDWSERFPEAYNIEFQNWINASKEGRVDGPTAWDGYVAQIAAGCASKARDTGVSVDIDIPEMPDFYQK
jgi:ABC-type cobalamin transport system permease subunit